MIKATKKDIETALNLAVDLIWQKSLPNGKCEKCRMMHGCKDCWKNYLISVAKEEGTK